MNASDKVPSLPFALQHAVLVAMAVAITLITTQTIVASATQPYSQAAATAATQVAEGDGRTPGTITVAAR